MQTRDGRSSLMDASWQLGIDQFATLATHLPESGGKPKALNCERCQRYLGAAANNAGVVIGSFVPEFVRDAEGCLLAIRNELVGVSLIQQSRVEIKCVSCRKVKLWRLSR